MFQENLALENFWEKKYIKEIQIKQGLAIVILLF